MSKRTARYEVLIRTPHDTDWRLLRRYNDIQRARRGIGRDASGSWCRGFRYRIVDTRDGVVVEEVTA